MKTNQDLKGILVKEFKTVHELMVKTEIPFEKNYYYSAIYAMCQRLLNIEYNRDLIFYHFVFQGSYNLIEQHLAKIRSGMPTWELSEDFFNQLEGFIQDVGNQLEKGDDDNLLIALKNILILSYGISGNGNYLKSKGINLLD